ncbi:DNA-directed RNA polymerase subunit omega [bacterium]|nr:DNA-directed RNA polymerase subunit omega [bacterium]
MIQEKKLEKWLSNIDSRHRAVLVVSQRAKQLQKGLRPYFDAKTSKVTTMAIEEFVNGKVDWYKLSQEEIDKIQSEQKAARDAEQKAIEKDIRGARSTETARERLPEVK